MQSQSNPKLEERTPMVSQDPGSVQHPAPPDDNQSDVVTEGPEGFEQVPHALIFDTALSDGPMRMWLALRRYGGRDDTRRFPGRSTLARELGKSIRTVDAHIGALVDAGWLLIEPRWREDTPGQSSNRYRLLWTRLDGHFDPRAAANRAAVEAFNTEMAARMAHRAKAEAEARAKAAAPADPADEQARKPRSVRPPAQDSAGGSPRRILRGGGAENCAGPAQDPAPQEVHLPTDHQPELHAEPTVPLPTPSGAGNQPADTQGCDPTGDTLPGLPPVTKPPKLSFSSPRRLPRDFAVTPLLRTWAAETTPDVDVDAETTRFVDWHRAKGATYSHWGRTWQNWMRKAQERAPAAADPQTAADARKAVDWYLGLREQRGLPAPIDVGGDPERRLVNLVLAALQAGYTPKVAAEALRDGRDPIPSVQAYQRALDARSGNTPQAAGGDLASRHEMLARAMERAEERMAATGATA